MNTIDKFLNGKLALVNYDEFQYRMILDIAKYDGCCFVPYDFYHNNYDMIVIDGEEDSSILREFISKNISNESVYYFIEKMQASEFLRIYNAHNRDKAEKESYFTQELKRSILLTKCLVAMKRVEEVKTYISIDIRYTCCTIVIETEKGQGEISFEWNSGTTISNIVRLIELSIWGKEGIK